MSKKKKVILYCEYPDINIRSDIYELLNNIQNIKLIACTSCKMVGASEDWHLTTSIKKEISFIQEMQPDLMLCIYIHEIISKEILDICPVIGFHPQDIEERRGCAPISHNIRNGITEDQVTMFYYTSEIDYGKIIARAPYWIEENDYSSDVVNKVMKRTCDIIRIYLPYTLRNIGKGYMPKSKGIYGKKLTFADNELKFDEMGSEQISRIIRATDIYGGAWINLKDGKKLKILKDRWEIEG